MNRIFTAPLNMQPSADKSDRGPIHPRMHGTPLALAAAAVLLLAGACAHLPRSPRPPTAADFVPVAVQHVATVGADSPFDVVEVYLVNTGATTRAFTSVTLGDRPLRAVRTDAMAGANLELEGRQVRLDPDPAADPDVAWWQFYPGAEVPPGQTTVLTVCFRHQIPVPALLVARDSAGGRVETPLTRRRFGPEPRISAVTFERDFSRVYVQCDAPAKHPAALWLNGWSVPAVRRLDGANARVPVLLCALPPFPIAAGMPLDVRVRFDDGSERRALVRAFAGISLDVADNLTTGIAHPGDLQLDPAPPVRIIPVDAVCSDLNSGRPGAAAWNVIAERQRTWRRRPDLLTGFVFCTAVTRDSWNIYGPIADAVYSKTYRHGWGTNPDRFLNEEQDLVVRTRTAAAPRPFLYIPERFERHGRHITPEELRVICWSAVAAGAKGVRYHFGMNPHGFADTPALIPAIVDFDRVVRKWEGRLAPVAPVSDEIQGDEKTGYVRVLTGWAGDRGIFFCVRNQNCGAFPAGAPPPRRNVRVALDIPAWCRGAQISDLESGATLSDSKPGRTNIVLPELATCRLLWGELR